MKIRMDFPTLKPSSKNGFTANRTGTLNMYPDFVWIDTSQSELSRNFLDNHLIGESPYIMVR